MLNKIKKFFDEHVVADLAVGDARKNKHGLSVAATALMLEMANQDDEIGDVELDALKQALKNILVIESSEMEELVSLAQDELVDAIDYFQFTSLINDQFEYTQKIQLIESLWLVAFADGTLHHYEEHMVRRISELIHVRHSDFVSAKHRVAPNI